MNAPWMSLKQFHAEFRQEYLSGEDWCRCLKCGFESVPDDFKRDGWDWDKDVDYLRCVLCGYYVDRDVVASFDWMLDIVNWSHGFDRTELDRRLIGIFRDEAAEEYERRYGSEEDRNRYDNYWSAR